MNGDLGSAFAELRGLARQLNEEADEATRIVQTIDFHLGELSLGIPSEVYFHRIIEWEGDPEGKDNDYYAQREFRLAYGRCKGRFRLHVVQVIMEAHGPHPDSNNPDWKESVFEETPWSSCDRETKLRAFAVLPQLLRNILDQTRRLAGDTVGASQTVKAMLHALAGEPM